MATCAVCLRILVHGQQFLLDGTEVVHATCAKQAYRSKQRLADQRVRELEAQLEATRQSAARVEAEAHRLRNEALTRRAEVIALQGRLVEAAREAEVDGERIRARQDELIAARREIADLRSELQALRPQVVDRADVDDAVVRFGLLELDVDR